MKKILVINGAQAFAHSGGSFNQSLVALDQTYFCSENGFDLSVTHTDQDYDVEAEVAKWATADVIVYHFPIWWFGMPNRMKQYIDEVLTAGHRVGLYHSDGRKADNPAINYGKGGGMQGKYYMVTTTWNAPETAFTLPGEFFQQKSVDEGVLFGFHRMNEFLGLSNIAGMHFHDLEKNATAERIQNYLDAYQQHLQQLFATEYCA